MESHRRLAVGDVVRAARSLLFNRDGPVEVPVGIGGIVKSDEGEFGYVLVVFPELRCKETFCVRRDNLTLVSGITGRDGLLRLMTVDRQL